MELQPIDTEMQVIASPVPKPDQHKEKISDIPTKKDSIDLPKRSIDLLSNSRHQRQNSQHSIFNIFKSVDPTEVDLSSTPYARKRIHKRNNSVTECVDGSSANETVKSSIEIEQNKQRKYGIDQKSFKNLIDGQQKGKLNTFETAIQERKFLNYVLVLFLLIIGRFGSELVVGDVANNITVPQVNQIIQNSTILHSWNVNMTANYLNLSYYSGSMFGEFCNLIIGILGVLILIPSMESYLKSRGADLTLIFITKQFYGQHLLLSIGIFITGETLLQIFSWILRELVEITLMDIILISNILCFISALAVMSLPFLDFETYSIFNTVLKRDPSIDADSRKYWHTGSSLPFIPAQIILTFILTVAKGFLEILSASWKYSIQWEQNAHIMQVFIHAISLPALGAVIDMNQEPFRQEVGFNTLMKRSYKLIMFYKWNFILFFSGILGISTMSALIAFSKQSVFVNLLAIAGFHGFFLACLEMSLFSIPLIFIRNIQFRYKTLLYPAYMNLIYFTISTAEMTKFWIPKTLLFDNVVWIYSTLIGILNVCSFGLFVPICLIVIGYKIFEKIQPFKSHDDFSESRVENDEKNESVINVAKIWQLIYLIPCEFMVLILMIFFLFTASGGLNILLHVLYSKQPNLNIPNIIFLPILFMFTGISGYFTFPNEIKRLVGAGFFRKSRRIIYGAPLHSIGETISANPAFCMAHDALKKKPSIYQGIWNDKLTPKMILSVLPDLIVLPNEEERYGIHDQMPTEVEIQKNEIEVIHCTNGVILIDRENINKLNLLSVKNEDIEPIEKSKFQGRFINSHIFYKEFHMFAYVGYFAFFLIPLIYKLILRAVCTGILCQNIYFFEDGIQGVILAIDFIFGFFLMIPFVEIYRELCKLLERVLHHAVFLKNHINTKFNFQNLDDYQGLHTNSLKILDIQISHLQNMITSKGEYLKYTLLFAMGVSKLFSVTFSMFALFVKGVITIDIMYIIYLIVIIELSVARFIMLPACVITSEFRNCILMSLAKEKTFNKYINSNDVDPKCTKVSNYWRSLHLPWEPVIAVQNVGFNVRTNFIAIRWWFTSSIMRNWIFSFLFTIIPSIMTYFVKQLV